VPDLIGRKFTAVMPGIKMVGDITCLPTRQGWLYLASVIDLCTHKLLGYAMAEHMRAELVVGAITMAAAHNQLAGGAIFHSDYAEPCVKPRNHSFACAGGVR